MSERIIKSPLKKLLVSKKEIKIRLETLDRFIEFMEKEYQREYVGSNALYRISMSEKELMVLLIRFVRGSVDDYIQGYKPSRKYWEPIAMIVGGLRDTIDDIEVWRRH